MRLRLAVRSLRRAQATSTASTCSRREAGEVGDLEGVGEEVALGVAEVGAVEPHVGLVEDAVEDHPVAGARRAGVELEAGAVEQRAVAVGERRRASASGRGRDRLPAVVVVVEPHGLAAQVVVGERGPPRSRQVHRRARVQIRLRPIGPSCRAARRRSPAGASGGMVDACRRPAPSPSAGHPRRSCGPPAGSRSRSRRRSAATPSPRSPPASRCSTACSATSTPSCRSSRTPCSPATT